MAAGTTIWCEAIGGPAVPGVGFGTGVERIVLASAAVAESLLPEARARGCIVVALTEAARERGLRACPRAARARASTRTWTTMARSGKGQMKQAGRSGAHYAFIIGEQEMADGTVTVRDLRRGEETSVSRERSGGAWWREDGSH